MLYEVITLNFAEPALYLWALGLGLGAYVKEINGVPYINFIAPGMIASSAMFAAVYETTYGTYVRRITSYNVCYTKLLRDKSSPKQAFHLYQSLKAAEKSPKRPRLKGVTASRAELNRH